ncbi:hypothetical protein [Helicobacter sp. MIT 05-5294]|uniref:hypothetical protein n=1 Tax=Helicobacter sp. MIT 05-5294 TaxID=1548150 RepID=UPI001883FCB5|nr:hypothetical protein [Helicobacter sp. MIT 05-5294]
MHYFIYDLHYRLLRPCGPCNDAVGIFTLILHYRFASVGEICSTNCTPRFRYRRISQ